MPLYAFTCHACGPFEAWRPLSESGRQAACPQCGEAARRVYTPPGLVRTPAAIRMARSLEEKSAHEPAVVEGGPGGLPGRPLRRPGHPTPPWATPKKAAHVGALQRL